MERKIRVGAVNYLNTKPLIYGIEKGLMKAEIDLIIDYPANIANQLVNNELDIGLIPVAAIPRLNTAHVNSNFCIACDGNVASVCLFSDVPLNEIKVILLDYQSRTSVALLKILLQEHWHINPVLLEAEQGYESTITGTTAGLVIGDRALQQRLKNKFIFDLGAGWKDFMGLPFVFAAWVSNKPMTANFIEKFNEANNFGLNNLEEVVKENTFNDYDLHKYYTENILFKPEFDKLEIITIFLKKLKGYK